MQKRENPYTPGAGRKPPNLAGRDRDLENFQSLTERLAAGGYERSLIYSGLRGVGKTVLLMELDVLATEAGWATTDVQEVGSQPDFRVTFARMAARLLREMSRKHRIKERVDRALGVVKAFSIAVPAGVQLKLDVEAATGVADSGDPEQDLTDLVREIGEVARITGAGALFLIDEMHNLDSSSLAAICIAFQAISRNALPGRDGRRRPPRPAGAADVGQALRGPTLSVPRARAPERRRRALRADRARGHARCQLRGARGASCRARVSRLPVLHPGVRARAVEPRRDLADHKRGRRGRARDRHRLARAQLLRHPLPAGHRRRAALPRRDGVSARARPIAPPRSPARTAPRISAASRSTATASSRRGSSGRPAVASSTSPFPCSPSTSARTIRSPASTTSKYGRMLPRRCSRRGVAWLVYVLSRRRRRQQGPPSWRPYGT